VVVTKLTEYSQLTKQTALVAWPAFVTGDGGYSPPKLYPWPPTDQIIVRPPPSLNITSPACASWTPPPKGYQYGNWWVSYSSNPEYSSIYNIQYDSYPLLPSGTYPLITTTGIAPNASDPPLVDLTSYNLPNTTSTAILTAFGYDFPRSATPWVFDFAGTGHLNQARNTWELLAWGWDAHGVEYLVAYETPVAASNISAGAPAGIDFESRVKGGPDAQTRAGLVAAVERLGVRELSVLVQEVVATPVDARRDGLPPVACDEACIDNVIFA